MDFTNNIDLDLLQNSVLGNHFRKFSSHECEICVIVDITGSLSINEVMILSAPLLQPIH